MEAFKVIEWSITALLATGCLAIIVYIVVNTVKWIKKETNHD